MRWLLCVMIFYCVSCLNVTEYGRELVHKQTQAKYLNAHNDIRKLVGSPDLTWDDMLESKAKGHADALAAHCDSGNIEDQSGNYYQSWGNIITPPHEVVSRWAKDQADQYMKIVNKNTLSVGCSFAICKDPKSLSSSVIHVCHYKMKSILDRLTS